jgi:HK97 family phage portal protein
MDFLERLRSPSPRATYAPWDNFWFNPAPDRGAIEGIEVSPEAALRLSSVWACVGIRSEAMASLPLILYRRLDRGKERATDHSLFKRLRWQPNPWQTAFEFEEMSEVHLCLRGNFYARIIEDRRRGQIVGLVPLHPDRVTPELLESGLVRYTYRAPKGGTQTLMQNEVHHRRGRSLDGVVGLSPITYASASIGLAMAGERFAASQFRGGAAPPFALKHPQTLGPDGIKNLKESVAEYRAGDKYLILEEGMDAVTLGVSARDAQILEARQYGIEEIARFYNVPLHMLKVNKAGSVSYASVEMFDLDFVMHTVRPEAVRNEQAMWRDLLSEPEQDEYYTEYLLDALMRGDSAARSAYYKALAEVEAITPNEIREKENFEGPLPDGDAVVKNISPTPAPSNTPRDPKGRPRGESEVRGRLITMEAAARVVQKEIAAATKAAQKFASDPKGWAAWSVEFYGDHAGFIGHVLKLPSNQAKAYAETQRAALAAGGVPVMADWETRVVPQLAALALGDTEHAIS